MGGRAGGGARRGPAAPPPPRCKIMGHNPVIIILEVYNLKPKNVGGGGISSVVMNP